MYELLHPFRTRRAATQGNGVPSGPRDDPAPSRMEGRCLDELNRPSQFRDVSCRRVFPRDLPCEVGSFRKHNHRLCPGLSLCFLLELAGERAAKECERGADRGADQVREGGHGSGAMPRCVAIAGAIMSAATPSSIQLHPYKKDAEMLAKCISRSSPATGVCTQRLIAPNDLLTINSRTTRITICWPRGAGVRIHRKRFMLPPTIDMS